MFIDPSIYQIQRRQNKCCWNKAEAEQRTLSEELTAALFQPFPKRRVSAAFLFASCSPRRRDGAPRSPAPCPRGPAGPGRPALQAAAGRDGAPGPRPSPLGLARRPLPARAREPSSSLRSARDVRARSGPGLARRSCAERRPPGARRPGRGAEPRFCGAGAGGPRRPLTAAVRSAERHLREGAALGSQNRRGLRARRAHRVSAARRGARGGGRAARAALRLRRASGDRDLRAGRYRGRVPVP